MLTRDSGPVVLAALVSLRSSEVGRLPWTSPVSAAYSVIEEEANRLALDHPPVGLARAIAMALGRLGFSERHHVLLPGIEMAASCAALLAETLRTLYAAPLFMVRTDDDAAGDWPSMAGTEAAMATLRLLDEVNGRMHASTIELIRDLIALP